MKLLQIYNQYRSLFGGEETVVERTAALVEHNGDQAKLFMRSSRGLDGGIAGKVGAFCSGIYSRASYREITREIEEDRPDVVHAHNLYPLLSPSVLVACRRAGLPVVMSLHNHALTCPNTNHLCHGQLCERCSGGREYWCVLRNCRSNTLESVAYAVRSGVARRWRLFHDNVTLLVALTEFAKRRLVDAGFEAERICVLPNMVEIGESPTDAARGRYVVFAGRMSQEKGVDTLLTAAGKLSDVPVRLAGDGPVFGQLAARKPDNAVLLGQLGGDELTAIYRRARLLVLPSKCYEMCPLVISEAMSHGLPVVASRIGGIPELVEDGVTGLLFEPGNADDLAAKIDTLWRDRELCRRMGRAGRERAISEYGEDVYYRRLMNIYQEAIRRAGTGEAGTGEAITDESREYALTGDTRL